MNSLPRAVVLLCAGRGKRMLPLTKSVPKCMLPVGGALIIDHLVDAITARTNGEIVAVTGFAKTRLERHLKTRYGDRLATTYNNRFDEDVNIMSVELGVAALQHPERGYLIVETDILMDDDVWDSVFSAARTAHSFWLCNGYYCATATGGILHVDPRGNVDAVEYQPTYNAEYRGWRKMAGILGVAPNQVLADRRHRQSAIAETVSQYYLTPWQHHLLDLPCVVLQSEGFVRSFNTPEDFGAASRRYLESLFP